MDTRTYLRRALGRAQHSWREIYHWADDPFDEFFDPNPFSRLLRFVNRRGVRRADLDDLDERVLAELVTLGRAGWSPEDAAAYVFLAPDFSPRLEAAEAVARAARLQAKYNHLDAAGTSGKSDWVRDRWTAEEREQAEIQAAVDARARMTPEERAAADAQHRQSAREAFEPLAAVALVDAQRAVDPRRLQAALRGLDQMEDQITREIRSWRRTNPSAFFDYPRDPYAELRAKIAQRPNRYADVLYQTLSLLTSIVTFPVDSLLRLPPPIPRLQREARKQQARAATLIELLAPWIGRSPPGGYTLADVRNIYALRKTAATYAAAFFETHLELAREELRHALRAYAPRSNISGDDLPREHPLHYAIPSLYAYVCAVTDFPEDGWLTDDDKALGAWKTATRIRADIESRSVDNLWPPAEWNALRLAGVRAAADFFTAMAETMEDR